MWLSGCAMDDEALGDEYVTGVDNQQNGVTDEAAARKLGIRTGAIGLPDCGKINAEPAYKACVAKWQAAQCVEPFKLAHEDASTAVEECIVGCGGTVWSFVRRFWQGPAFDSCMYEHGCWPLVSHESDLEKEYDQAKKDCQQAFAKSKGNGGGGGNGGSGGDGCTDPKCQGDGDPIPL